jgi:copper(I)-binding protein
VPTATARATTTSTGPVHHAVAVADVDTNLEADVAAVFYLGPDTSGEPIEVVVIQDDDGNEIAVHAMKMGKRYQYLLPGEES